MRFFIWLAILSVLASSAFSQPVRSWLGSDMNLLISDWGSPDLKIIQANGNTLLIYNVVTYRTHNTLYSPQVGVNVGSGGRPVIVVSPTDTLNQQQDISLTCTVKYEVDKHGIIVNINMQGNGCRGNIHP